MLSEAAQALERVRAARAEKERAVHDALGSRTTRADDGRVMALFDWYTASLDVHRSLASLEFKEQVSDDELQLIYIVGAGTERKRVTIALDYHPGDAPRRLKDAVVDVDGQEEPALKNLMEAHVEANDVRGLVRDVLMRVRQTV